MERGLVVGRREAVFVGAASVEESLPLPSQCSSGCQSGWTLYLDHSDGQQRCVHVEPGRQRRMLPRAADHTDEEYNDDDGDDSMVSDASSGQRPRLLDDDDEEELRQDDRARCGSNGSGSFGSHLSRSFHGQTMRSEEATRQYRGVIAEDDDDLDDTASSSARGAHLPPCVVYIARAAESMSSTRYTMQ